MKRRLISLVLLGATLAAIIASLLPLHIASAEGTTRTIRLALLTDVHYVNPDDVPAEGTQGRVAFNHAETAELRLMSEVDSVLTEALDGAIASKPDAILVSGDLTSNGEYANAQAFSQRLRDAKTKLSDAGIYVVNGNHDMNMSYAARFAEDSPDVQNAQRIEQEDWRNIFADLGYKGDGTFTYYADSSSDAAATAEVRNSGGLSYATRISDDITLIALDTAMYGNDSQAKFNNAQQTAGYVNENLLAWAAEQAKAGKERGDIVLVMAHHAMLPHYTEKNSLIDSFMSQVVIGNWEKVANTLADAGVTAFITGHSHSNDIAKHVSPNGNTIYDINTAALCAYPCAWRTLEITVDGTGASETFQFEIDTTFIESAEGIDDLQLHSYHKTGIYEDKLEPLIDYNLRLYLYDMVNYQNDTYGTGLAGYLAEKLSIPADQGSLGTYAVTKAKELVKTIDVKTPIDFFGGPSTLSLKFNRAEGDVVLFDVSLTSQDGSQNESGVLSIDLAALPPAIDSILTQVQDQLARDENWTTDYVTSPLQADINKLAVTVLTKAGTKLLDDSDPNSSALQILNEAYQAYMRGDESTFVWRELGMSAGELADKRAYWRSLLQDEKFANTVSTALSDEIKALNSSSYPVLSTLIQNTSLVSEGHEQIVKIETTTPGHILPGIGALLGAITNLGDLTNLLSVINVNPVPASVGHMAGNALVDIQRSFSTDTNIVSDATWEFHRVRFDAQGGTVSPDGDLTVENGKLGRSSIEGASLPVPEREGYRFDGWYTKPTGGDAVQVDSDYTNLGRIYAQWTFTGSYACTDGDGSSWTQKSGVTLPFTFQRSVEPETTLTHLVEVRADGKAIGSDCYTTGADNMTIRLTPAYLKTLSVGEHTIVAQFDDVSDGVSASFSVVAPADEGDEEEGDTPQQDADDEPTDTSVTPAPTPAVPSRPTTTTTATKLASTGDDMSLALVPIFTVLGFSLVLAGILHQRHRA